MKQINKNIFWNAVGNTAYNGLQWLITVIVTRCSGLGASGILAAAMSVSLTFRTISYFGIRNFYISDRSGDISDGEYFGFRTASSAAAFVLCMIFSLLGGYDAQCIAAIALYMLFRVSEGFSDLFYGIMQKNDRLDTAGKFQLLKAVITTAAFSAGYFSVSLNAGLLLMSCSSVIISFAAEMPAASKLSDKTLPSFSKLIGTAEKTLPVFIYQLENSVIFNMPQFILIRCCGTDSAGAYSSVFSLAITVQAIFQYTYVPFLTKLSACDEKQFQKLLLRLGTVLFAISAAFIALSAFFGENISAAVFGDELKSFGELMLPAAASACCYSFMSFGAALVTMRRRFDLLILSHGAAAAVSAVSSVLFAKLYGISGASFGMTAASVTALIFMLSNPFSRKNK